MHPPEVALFLYGPITLKHCMDICRLSVLRQNKNYTLQNIFKKTNLYFNISSLISWEKHSEEIHTCPKQVSKFETPVVMLLVCWSTKHAHLIPATLPPLPKGLCSLRCGVGSQWPQSPNSLPEPSFTWIQEKWKTERYSPRVCFVLKMKRQERWSETASAKWVWMKGGSLLKWKKRHSFN